MIAVQPLAAQVGVAPACQALGVSRATFYRRQRPTPGHQQPRPTPARALCESEREHVLDVLACPRFVDRAPAEVVATLLDEGQYLCSARTMYRILAANQPVRERRNQRDHPPYKSTFDGEIVRWPCKGKSKTGKQPRQVMSLSAVQRMRPERDEIIVCTGLKIAGSGIQYSGSAATGLFAERQRKGR